MIQHEHSNHFEHSGVEDLEDILFSFDRLLIYSTPIWTHSWERKKKELME